MGDHNNGIPTILIYVVPPEQDGWKLRSVLLTGMKLSRKLLVRLKGMDRAVTVNGAEPIFHVPIHAGDRIEVRLPEETSEDILPQPIPIEIISEDEHLFIINKPWGRIVHPTSGHYVNTVANGVVHLWQQRGDRHRFRPIHRLDQDTSGVLAIAKNAYAHQYVSEQFQSGRVSKTYIAIVHGLVAEDFGTIDGPIDRDATNPHVRVVTPEGYPSVTHYEVLERLAGASVVKVKPVTGRTHQIRVHMTHIGHPLVGDSFYSLPDRYPPFAGMGRQALHAATLSFRHPGTGDRVEYEAPQPDDIRECIEALRLREE